MENIFDLNKSPLKIDKPIRLIELFAGVGSQAKALERLGADFEHYRISEWEVNAAASYKAIHKGKDNTDYSAEFTAEELTEVLYNIGISTDGKKPLTLKEISRKGEEWKRTVYNNFKATNNIGSILNISGDDLGIVDTDIYCYIMTYSFPCQDLSLAGKGNGMAKGSGTRSGLLWEVERLLNECTELPQILLMENVTQVHGKKNKEHFDKWIKFLESKGYSNYWQDLNAKNFGIPQNRNRTFMVSVLGEYTYEFPQEFPLELRLKDMLEDAVDEKFYLSGKMINYFRENTKKQQAKGNGFKFAPSNGSGCGKAITTRAGGRMDDNFIEEQPVLIGGMQKNQAVKTDGISTTLTGSMGMGGGYVPMVTEPKCEQAGILTGEKWDKMHDVSRRVYSANGIAPTLHTCGGGNTEPKVLAGIGEKKSNGGAQWDQQDRIYDNNVAISVTTGFNPYYKVDEPFIVASRGRNPENPSDRTAGIHLEQRLEANVSGCANTLTTVQKDNYVAEPLAYDEQNGYVRKDGTVGTLTTDGSSPKHNNRVIENCYVSEKGVRFICSPKRGMTTDVNAEICQPLTANGQANWTGSFVSPDIKNLEKSSTIGSTEPTKINLKSGETVYFDGENFTNEPMVWDGFNQRIRAEKGTVGTLTRNCGADLKRNGQGIIEPIVCEQRADEGLRFFKGDYSLKNIDACGDKMIVEDCHVKHFIKENNKNARHRQDLLQHSDDICRCIPAGTHGSTPHLTKTVVCKTPLRIRKLTPKECWRLMGFDDADFEKAAAVNSNSQLYKQAGNSIVVDVLYYIFKNMGGVFK